MKKAVLAAFVAAASFQAVGAENIGSQHGYLGEGWYIGADIIDTTFEADGFNGSPSSTSGAISIGYDFTLADSVILGIEAEYADYGKFDFVDNVNVNNRYVYANGFDKFSADLQAFSLYLKPKYFVSNSPFYIGAVVGVGVYSMERKSEGAGTIVSSRGTRNLEYNNTKSESETEFVYGLETGYALNNNVILNAGYRMANLKHYEHDTWYVGLDYKF
ncbi:outer membrane beta-barrel protein [Vibrio tetraodonis]|uniref:outer membrane beta-barrel protein n=1 Tax=Vibrio tetraodonis TaxID=2231647 RepID=UPI000E0BA707|nr:outer membrane beta-barrel protein [Vibrio tetraodonis]